MTRSQSGFASARPPKASGRRRAEAGQPRNLAKSVTVE